MKDRQPAYPGRYKGILTSAELTKLQAGQEFHITLTRDDEPTVAGTPYSKAAVLPDNIAAMICPELADPTPADALAHLMPGYGLGPYSVATEAELKEVLSTVMSYMADGTSKSFSVNCTSINSGLRRVGLWFVTIRRETSLNATISAVRATTTEAVCYMGFNTIIGGFLDEWEWLNPHMNLGTEYKTPFRVGSAPVFVKVVNFGTLPASGSKTKAHGCTDIGRIVFASIYSTEGMYLTADASTHLWIDTESIVVTVDEENNCTAHVFMAYTKEV